MGPSPLHASSVGLILNPKTNRISPQYHCIYDDYFETVSYDQAQKPPNWEDLIIQGISQMDLELDPDDAELLTDNWEEEPQTIPSESQTKPFDTSDSGAHKEPPLSIPQESPSQIPLTPPIPTPPDSVEQREPSTPPIPQHRETTPPL